MSENGSGSTALQTTDQQAARPILQDDGQNALLMDTHKFEHCWRVAKMFSSSQLVPKHYQGQPQDCMIALHMANRLGVDPMMFMQKAYVVNGSPGMEAQLSIALVNQSGKFQGPLIWELGDDPKRGRYAKCYQYYAQNGQYCEAVVDWAMAEAEGWTKNPKWKSMTDQMLRYRSGSFFGRLYAPECLMGMNTVDELADMQHSEPVSDNQLPKPGRMSLADEPEAPGPTAADFPDQGTEADQESPAGDPSPLQQDEHGEAPEQDSPAHISDQHSQSQVQEDAAKHGKRAPFTGELEQQLATRLNVDQAAANDRLKKAAADEYGNDFSKLNADARRDVAQRIEAGEFDQ